MSKQMNIESALRTLFSKFLVVIAATIILLVSYYCHAKEAACIEYEKQALLSFNQRLIDPSNRLSSWIDGVDCCNWDGVVCNNITNHVTGLHLRNPKGSDPCGGVNFNYLLWALTGKLDPSLLHLKQLRFLDLSLNDFKGIPIPGFTGSLKSLRYLNLSHAGFSGIIPHQLGNLSNLRTLSMEGEFDNNHRLQVDTVQWLTGLSNLQYLDMSTMDLSKISNNLLQVINMIPSLVELRFSWCRLGHISHHLIQSNSSSLAILDLSGNELSSLPRWIFGIRTLASLDLHDNGIEGPLLNHLYLQANYLNGSSLPRKLFNLNNLILLYLSESQLEDLNLNGNTCINMTNLEDLDISSNNLHSSIPKWLYNCKRLKSLELHSNHLQGAISDDIGNLSSIIHLGLAWNELTGRIPNKIGTLCEIKWLDLSRIKLAGLVSDVIDGLSGCFSYSIEYLFLDTNHLSGQLTEKLGQFQNLQWLTLDDNSITGPIPPNIGALSSLESLSLSYNKLNGTIPPSLGKLSKLFSLRIEYNVMEGIVTQSQFENLTSLKYMMASGNSLTLQVDQNWVPLSQFYMLGLRSWNLGPRFPSWLRSQRKIQYLDLSSTGISGTIPTWLWMLSTDFMFLNLSNNQSQGKISNICCIGSHVDLSSNQFSGQLPQITSYFGTTLDLSSNSFSGGFSDFLCDEGNITRQMENIDLGKNLLSGKNPDCWMNWPYPTVINLASNNFIGSIPRSIGQLKNLRFLKLRNNSLSGRIPSYLRNCTELTTIDFARNKLGGKIPNWFGVHISNLKILILRCNNFHGELPAELCHLNSLRIIHVSNNKCFGAIPRCFKNFTSMTREKNVLLDAQITGNYTDTDYIPSENLANKGNEYDYGAVLSFFTSIDLSNNYFSSNIPDKLTSLLELKSLNLSGNQFKGMIPKNIGQMRELESLDLSRNNLSGTIPSSISQLSFLSFLNLSYNNLSGEIPLSTQMQSFDASCFIGNQLCGRPLTEHCSISPSNGVTIVKEGSAEGGVDWLIAQKNTQWNTQI